MRPWTAESIAIALYHHLFKTRCLVYTPKNPSESMEALLKRIPPEHLKRRLILQMVTMMRLYRSGFGYFQLDQVELIPLLAKIFFKMTGLYRVGYKNFYNFQLIHNTMAFQNLPIRFHNFKILHLSDLHLDLDAGFTERLIKQLEGLRFDLCVLTGDYRWRTLGPLAANEMNKLRPFLECPFGVYAVLGNHDFIEMVPYLEAIEILVLLNEAVVLKVGNETIGLAGVDDPHHYGTHNLSRAVENINDQKFKILLAHSPDLYQPAARQGFDLYLTGHTHGGQICLPGGVAPLFNAGCERNFCQGRWQYQQMTGYTSSGAGGSGIPLRFYCRPEIVIHHLQGNGWK